MIEYSSMNLCLNCCSYTSSIASLAHHISQEHPLHLSDKGSVLSSYAEIKDTFVGSGQLLPPRAANKLQRLLALRCRKEGRPVVKCI